MVHTIAAAMQLGATSPYWMAIGPGPGTPVVALAVALFTAVFGPVLLQPGREPAGAPAPHWAEALAPVLPAREEPPPRPRSLRRRRAPPAEAKRRSGRKRPSRTASAPSPEGQSPLSAVSGIAGWLVALALTFLLARQRRTTAPAAGTPALPAHPVPDLAPCFTNEAQASPVKFRVAEPQPRPAPAAARAFPAGLASQGDPRVLSQLAGAEVSR